MAMAAIALLPSLALSDSISYSLTQFDQGNSFPAPYGTVDVSLDTSTHTATVTFTAATNSSSGGDNYAYGFIDSSAAGINVNSTNFTYNNDASTTQASFAGNAPSIKTTGNPGNVDGVGSYNFGINLNDGSGSAAASITFSITDNTDSWSSASQVLLANSDGNVVEAHVVPYDNTTSTLYGKSTGFTANAVANPEPGSSAIALALLAPVSAAIFVRRRRHRSA
jgi:hypothetical protein